MSLLGLARKLIKEVGDEKGSALLDKVKDRSITISEIKEIRDAGIDLQALKKELGDVPKTKPKSIFSSILLISYFSLNCLFSFSYSHIRFSIKLFLIFSITTF